MVPVTDRGWLYGDGLFDTMRLFEGKPFLWHQHIQRLMQGAALMLLRMPYSKSDLAEVVGHLMELNDFYDGVLRIQLSRAGKKRGYAPSNASDSSEIGRLFAFDTSDAEGYGYPRIGIQIAIPTEYYEATRRSPAYPFVNNAFVEKGVFRTMGETVCRHFKSQGKIRDIKL